MSHPPLAKKREADWLSKGMSVVKITNTTATCSTTHLTLFGAIIRGFTGACARVQPALALDRYRPKGVFGKGVGNSKNASEMRQKCVKIGLVLLGKEERPKMRQKCVKIASQMRQKCAEHLWGRTPFGQYRLERGANSQRKKKL